VPKFFLAKTEAGAMVDVEWLDPHNASWATTLDRVYALLGGPANVTLFPYHFLQVVLTRIGGHVLLIHHAGQPVAVGLLFPRQSLSGADRHCYTLRYQPISGAPEVDRAFVAQQIGERLGGSPLVVYDPLDDLHFSPSHTLFGPVDIGRPDASEATAIRQLQQQVWGSPPEYLYPADIHSDEFGLGTSLVARMDQQPVGFLFGFIKFGGYALPADWHTRFGGVLRLESQTLGVLPAYRGAKVGFLLKQQQAMLARQAGIGVVNWTVDPLQWPNAVLNFGRLRAVAFDFTPDYYPFRNELNRVAASRFSLTWLVKSRRVQAALDPIAGEQPSSSFLDLSREPAIVRVNDGWRVQVQRPEADRIAIEIPADWTALQRDDLDQAIAWRATTDQIFQQWIGSSPGYYVITAVGIEGDHRYLIGERVSDELWARLGEEARIDRG
jgi:predicted GNAT superfamily acetyltransferase